MKKINKIALELQVPPTSFNTWESLNLPYLEKFHESTLRGAGLTGYTKELGDNTNYRNNLVNTQPTFADSYYFPFSDYLKDMPLREIIGLNDSNYFKTIYQVCVLLRKNWYILQRYRDLSINEGRTHMLFPFVNYLNEKCLGSIDVWYGETTFSSGLNLNDSKYNNSNIGYYGNSCSGLMIILPCNNEAEFLKSNLLGISKNYRLLSLEDFKKEILIISKTTGIGENVLRRDKRHKIEERIRVELSYLEDELDVFSPVKFIHPEGSFIFDFDIEV